MRSIKLVNKIKYAYTEIKEHGGDPYWWKYRIIDRVIGRILSGNDGVKVMKEDWNNLIILDGCRYDIFNELNTLKGDLKCIKSIGSTSQEFLLKNFTDEKYDDVIYVTGNPLVDVYLSGKFHKIVSVWDEGWDHDLNTVTPTTMVEYAIRACEEYPNKRFIFHFMQPHHPFIGKKIIGPGLENLRNLAKNSGNKEIQKGVWKLVEEGKIDKEEAWEAYKDNLKLVLPHIEKMIDYLRGRTVVTSDHGDVVGEYVHPLIPVKVYGHVGNLRLDSLVKVPWLVLDLATDENRERQEPEDD